MTNPGFSAPDRWVYLVLTVAVAALAAWSWRAPRDPGPHPLRRLAVRVLPTLALALALLTASGFDPMDAPVPSLRVGGVRPTLEVLGTLAWFAALGVALGMPLPRRALPRWTEVPASPTTASDDPIQGGS